ncbi:MAG: YibE/F family protein [Firmicutes bacterium]|nr:YibE/F family protein [Bacillota bacterium]
MIPRYCKYLLFLGIISIFSCLGAIYAELKPDPDKTRTGAFNSPAAADQAPEEIMVKGIVTGISKKEKVLDPVSKKHVDKYQFKVRIYSGGFRGREIIAGHNEVDNPVFNIKIAPKDRVSLVLTVKDGRIQEAYIVDLIRENQVYLLLILFIVLLLACGWRKGAKALCGLILTLVLIWGVLLPGFLRGYHPILLTVAVATISAAITILVIGGITLKSWIAVLGTLGGVSVSGGLALLAGKAAHLTGFGTEEAAMLLYIPQKIQLDMQGLLFAGIIIGALGAAMDVSISMAAAMEEVKRVCPSLNPRQLIRSGMNVGRDIMGAQASTLILAYTGSSVQLILIFMAYNDSLLKIINLDVVASEIIRALSGSIGMIMVIPITAIIAGFLLGKKNNNWRESKKPKEPKGQTPMTGAEFLNGWEK